MNVWEWVVVLFLLAACLYAYAWTRAGKRADIEARRYAGELMDEVEAYLTKRRKPDAE